MANVFTVAARTIISKLLAGLAQPLPVYIGWGTGAGVAAAADTTLFTEDAGGAPAYARVAGVASLQTTTTASDTYQVSGTLVANSAKTITNVGLFDANAAGNLFLKADFPGVALNAGDGIQWTLKVQFS